MATDPPAEPATPPPAYESAQPPQSTPAKGPPAAPPSLHGAGPSGSPTTPHAGYFAAPFPHTHAHGAGFGPTPLAAHSVGGGLALGADGTVQLLPYYDARSPHALAQAAARAQSRFFGALFWAVVVLFLTGSLGGSAGEAVRRSMR